MKGNRYDWDKGVKKFIRGRFYVFEVDTDKAEYIGRKWKTLGQFGKRKWENMLWLNNEHEGLRPLFIYKP